MGGLLDNKMNAEAGNLPSLDHFFQDQPTGVGGVSAKRQSPSSWLGPLPEEAIQEPDGSPKSLPTDGPCDEDPIWPESKLSSEDFFPSFGMPTFPLLTPLRGLPVVMVERGEW